MYIYKITVLPINQIYIGFDTQPSYKLKRWKSHCKNALPQSTNKLHQAMAKFGIDNCKVEIIEDGFTSVVSLAIAEIEYIKQFDSYNNGLNSTRGGDGMGRHILNLLSVDEIEKIKKVLGDNLKEYNKKIKWANTTPQDRKNLTKHLHNEEVYKKKSETLKKYYELHPEEKNKKKLGIMKWQKDNKETLCKNNKMNSLKGAAKNSKKLLVELPSGVMLNYASKSDFLRQTGQWANTVINKTKQGLYHNGYKAWEQ